eukprot:TRINITY_DN29428_c0_g1_i1.p1 TRINITY_DN29428_c0_g1~~TRINITY_DN29428_c0_g1_i1.p1  ORF type:complete len:4234 (+),score=586.19 TRINITY_DN29428_c0_g1_i1:35-12736(+)
MAVVKFCVKFTKETLEVELPESATVLELKEHLERQTGVPVAMQKLMFKGQLKEDEKTLADVGIKSNAKLMLIGSTVQQVIDAVAPAMKKQKQETKGGVPAPATARPRPWSDPFWQLPSYAALFADPFVDGKGRPMEGGHIAQGLAVVNALYSRIGQITELPEILKQLGQADNKQHVHPLLTLFTPADLQQLADAHRLLSDCSQFAATAVGIVEPPDIVQFVSDWTHRVRNLGDGQRLLVPGGWLGMAQQGWVMHLIERTGLHACAFVTCATGAGLEYHPSTAAFPPKMKYRTCLRIEQIPVDRMADTGFWTTLFSLWMKPNNPKLVSEYNRVEVLYDVLLPWLAEQTVPPRGGKRLLSEALHETSGDPGADWRTPQRSATGSTRTVFEVVRYVLARQGIQRAQLKQLSFTLRYEGLLASAEDLLGRSLPYANQPHIAPAVTALREIGVTPALPTLEPFLQEITSATQGVLQTSAGRQVPLSQLAGKVVALYFSAHWCPPCQQFTPVLIEAYRRIKDAGKNFEVVFLSADKTREEWRRYSEGMPWLMAPYPGNSIFEKYGIRGIPSLLLFSPDGILITSKGTQVVYSDPEGGKFPASPWDGAVPLTAMDAKLLRIGCEQLAAVAIKEADAGRLNNLPKLKQLVDAVDALTGLLPRDVSEESAFPPELAIAAVTPQRAFPNCELLLGHNVDGYAGKPFDARMPSLADFLEVPTKVESADQALLALVRCDGVCKKLLQRAKDAGTSSRLALQYEMIALITTLCTDTLPIPASPDAAPEVLAQCIWHRGFHTGKPAELQTTCLEHIFRLTLVFATAWQAVEVPLRGFDSERALVSASLLVLFDAIARMSGEGFETAILPYLLAEDGGYALSTGVCENCRPFESMQLELSNPALLPARDAVMRYFSGASRTRSRVLFDLRMPDKMEIRKWSDTVNFLRKFMERCGYQLTERNAMMPQSEMEALMFWLTDGRSPLAREHPEFGMLRDMVVLFKFLATMESREAELVRKRKDLGEHHTWRLSFEEDAGHRFFGADWRTSPAPPRWELMSVRGRDLDIADLQVVAFGDRELRFGEGPSVTSPADLGRMLQLPHPSEDDVLHADKLPNFGGALSAEESEMLLGYLTVEYTRVPLVLDFFASQDRATYLFSPALQQLLRAVLFEPGTWVRPTDRHDVTSVPMRLTALQKREKVLEQFSKANATGDSTLFLGTTRGLLLNELRYAPEATLRPILTIVGSIVDLVNSSVYSTNAPFVLFMASLAIDVETFVVYVLQDQQVSPTSVALLQKYRADLSSFLTDLVAPALERWRVEAESAEDMLSSCVIHSYIALLYTNVQPHEFTPKIVVALLGSLAYVRARHGFGMGMLRSQLLEQDGDLPAEVRLVRFLQAQGLDTSNVNKQYLEQGRKYMTSGGRRRALFVHISSRFHRDTVRVPTLFRQTADGATDLKIPPADVPESLLFSLLQRHRRALVQWFDRSAVDVVDNVLQHVAKVVLRGQKVPVEHWGSEGHGRYQAPQSGLQVDVQGAELFWRNDELRPVPDSMTHFADFETILGKEALQCGLIGRTEHRHWVHIVGTEFDLIEWDSPSTKDMGVRAPRVASDSSVCMLCGEAGRCWLCATCTAANCGVGDTPAGTPCKVCGTPRAREATQGQQEQPDFDDVVFEGIRFNRPLDPYSVAPHPVDNERWAVDLLRPVLLSAYPNEGDMKWKLLFPTGQLAGNAAQARLIGNDAKQHEEGEGTWKEFIVLRTVEVVHVYNLVSHGRKIFRSLIYSSNSALCLHSLAPIMGARRSEFIDVTRLHAGDLKRRAQPESSLVVLRHNKLLGGTETYLPPRLLQGLIPSCILSNFHIWLGNDNVLRGEPIDKESQWFNYVFEVPLRLIDTGACHGSLCRKPVAAGFSVIGAGEGEGPLRRSEPLQRQKSLLIEAVPEEATLQLLGLTGGNISLKACQLALRRCSNDIMAAFDWLADTRNRAEVLACEVEDAMVPSSPTKPMDESFLAAVDEDEVRRIDTELSDLAEPDANQGTYQTWGLLNLMDAVDTPDSVLSRLALAMARIEDLSDVLVWTTTPDDAEAKISLIELPRLKAKFQPQRDSDGVLRLFLLDHPGWFVSDKFATTQPSGSTSLAALVRGLDQYLLLENHAHELALMVPNHDVHRLKVMGDPFSDALLFDRSSLGWQEAMGSAYYVYPVHPSCTFVLPSSLSSTMYFALLRLLKFDYSRAFTLIEACSVDTKFTAEEQWVFSQFVRSLDSECPDNHPDAHACRLRLSLAVLYSENKAPWQIHVELTNYLSKRVHVSASCFLTDDEELDLLVRCEKGTPIIKNRLAYLKLSSIHGDRLHPENPPHVEQRPAPMQWGGQPWVKLCLLRQDYLYTYASTLTTVKYKQPSGGVLQDKDAIAILWEDLLLADEESGTNRSLGFVFLYELCTGSLRVALNGTDCTKSLSEILTRYFHLKLARWGKELREEGESEPTASRNIASLAALAELPTAGWPAVPRDCVRQLGAGLNLNTPAGRESSFKRFLDTVDTQFRASLPHIAPLQLALQASVERREVPAASTVPVLSAPALGAKWRPKPSDTSCSLRSISAFEFGSATPGDSPLALKAKDLHAFATAPLAVVDFSKYVDWHAISESVSEELPFSGVRNHPLAQTVVAQDMLNRIAVDMRNYASKANNGKTPHLKFLAPIDVETLVDDPASPEVANAQALLRDLEQELLGLQDSDAKFVEKAIAFALEKANHVGPAESGAASDDFVRTRFLLRRYFKHHAFITLDWLTAALLSSSAEVDLRVMNPFLEGTDELLRVILSVLLHCNRYHHANQALMQVRTLQGSIRQLQRVPTDDKLAPVLSRTQSAVPDKSSGTVQRVQQMASSLAETLTSQRHYVRHDDATPGSYLFDPRFIVFEYIFNLLLRKRQVEMIEWFVDNLRNGQSRVQQMIMGAGKTTVVGPLLTLILADGNTLVTQVMPTALLEQTRNILRRCFCAIIPKQVYTLQFDRAVEDNVEIVGSLFAKLLNACRQRAVICAPPEAIKSLLLKFVEHLHSVEKFDLADVLSGESIRGLKEGKRLRDRMIIRSDMADALVKILRLWQSGVLIMDEVDVLLSPLRSELNFPIGHKIAIDLAGHRWDLPIHLMDALFYRQRGHTCSEIDLGSQLPGLLAPQDLLAHLARTIDHGIEIHALQREPHPVLLDPNFYNEKLRHALAQWTLYWLRKHFSGVVAVTNEILLEYLEGDQATLDRYRECITGNLLPESLKLLNLARNWLRTLLPHVISKIDRVSFGLLSPADLILFDSPNAPLSRRLMAVPFIAKDVPSRSSEFAHPDVLIGLTVLAYRYEGIRKSDLRNVMTQLKQYYSQQVGPREQRPACQLFNQWLRLAARDAKSGILDPQAAAAHRSGVLPLSLFQPNDPKQLNHLHQIVRKLPELIHYHLRQHVFPATMNFQQLKISACGHELGSSVLFGKRIGFSGTPSNLLPVDLGDCQYEPGSDGRIVHVLTNPKVATSEVLRGDWTPQSLLRDIAQANPPFHALIDTGAFITNMENEEVARVLLMHLPEWFEGVVFLDREDRQMMLLRSSGRVVPLSQCGVSLWRRFTFYDQIHTTGMDIKQAPTAAAVVTIGKDMTFRDYAQGAFRMRGIGKGQTIHLYIIPEVQNRMRQQLTAVDGPGPLLTGRAELDVPAWLLLNSMRMESLQFVKLSTQELFNIWRKMALKSLTDEVELRSAAQPSLQRLQRFVAGPEGPWLKKCIDQFREPIGFPVPEVVPIHRPYTEKISEMVSEHTEFTPPAAAELVRTVAERVQQTATSGGDNIEALGLNTEVVHEQEAEQEAEEEAEEEEQKVSAYARDDEQHLPWEVENLRSHPGGAECPFYPLSHFRVRAEQPTLAFPPSLWLSDNFFKTRWAGLGDRRLKNVVFVLEWCPAEARDGSPARYIVALSLAEGETLRWMIHTQQPIVGVAGLAVRTVSGVTLDWSQAFQHCASLEAQDEVAGCLQCLRFLNCEMFYTDLELGQLERSLKDAPLPERRNFFSDCLRLRRRQRNLWGDTPLAKIFTPQSEWHLLRGKATLQYMQDAIRKVMIKGKLNPIEIFRQHVGESSAGYEQLLRILESLRLGCAPGDYQEVIRLLDSAGTGMVTLAEFKLAFAIPDELPKPPPRVEATDDSWICAHCTCLNPKGLSRCDACGLPGGSTWQCRQCTYVNSVLSMSCEACGLGVSGERECPPGQWMCDPTQGGCTKFNADTLFYCEACDRARPDLTCSRF